MSPPAALEWADDRLALHQHGVSIEPVTAWAMLTGTVLSKSVEEYAFFSVIDVARQPSEVKQLQNLIKVDPSFSPDVIKKLIEALEARPEMSQPRLFKLPLPRSSLPVNVDDELGYEPGGVSENSLPGINSINDPDVKRSPRIMSRIRPSVIVGIIDYAINLAHARFQHVDGDGVWRSRIAHAWLQGGTYLDKAVPFGRDFDDVEIAEALQDAHGDDETALRALGILSFGGNEARAAKTELARHTSHGTHVLDLAAGMDPSDPHGMEVQIIAVALPDAVRRDTTGTTLSLFFECGLEYILQRCRDIAGIDESGNGDAIPLFVCASLGFTGGPRDGQHLIEHAIDELVGHHETMVGGEGSETAAVFVPAGNSNLARGHAVSAQDVGEVTLAVPWRLQPGDRTANHLEAWIAYEGERPPERIEISLVPPGTLQATEMRELKPGESKLLVLVKGEVTGPEEGAEPEHRAVGRAAFEEMPGDLFRLTIALAATDPGLSGRPAAAPGAWGLEITARAPEGSATKLEINAWILRDDDPFEHSANARQSYFDAHDYIERDPSGELKAKDPKSPGSVVRRCGSLNAIATGSEREVVGGFVQPPPGAQGAAQVPTPAPYSGTPLPAKERLLDSTEAVAWSAPCESSKVLSGVLAAGTRSGSLTAMNGTSAAVPQVVRAKVNPFWDPEPKQIHFFPAAEPGKEPDPRLGKRPIRSPLAHNRIEARATPRRSDPRL